MTVCKKLSAGLFVLVMFLSSFAAFAQVERYSASAGVTTETETITFDTKAQNITKMNIGMPDYSGAGTNNCAPTAGGILLGYYDIFKPNLLPNFESTFYYNGVYYFNTMTTAVSAIITNLYNLMGTDVGGAGTTLAGFKRGFSSYVEDKGYGVQYESVMKNGNFNLDLYLSKINSQKPVALFIRGFKYMPTGGFTTTPTSENHIKFVSDNNGHACIAYGYKTVTYYRGGSAFRTDNYLLVSFTDATVGYLLMNNYSTIENALAVVV